MRKNSVASGCVDWLLIFFYSKVKIMKDFQAKALFFYSVGALLWGFSWIRWWHLHSSLYYSWLLTTDSKIASYEFSYNAPTDWKKHLSLIQSQTLQKVFDRNFSEPTNPDGPNIKKKSGRRWTGLLLLFLILYLWLNQELGILRNCITECNASWIIDTRCGRVVRDFESQAKTRCNFQFW